MAREIRATRKNPCPICGHPDWCWQVPKEKSPMDMNVFCKRTDSEIGDAVVGYDGKTYLCWTHSRNSGMSIFETEEYANRFKKGSGKQPVRKAYVPTEKKTVERPLLPSKQLDMIYKKIMSVCPLTKGHREYMHQQGVTDDMLQRWSIGSIPPAYSRERISRAIAELVALGVNLEGCPGMYRKDGVWNFYAPEGILFPVFDVNNRVVRLRVRRDRTYKNAAGKMLTDSEAKQAEAKGEELTKLVRYLWVSSNPEHEVFRDGGTLAASVCSVYYRKGLDTRTCWLIEGEKKCMIWQEQTNNLCISCPGVTNIAGLYTADSDGVVLTDVLWKAGVRNIIICFDADKTEKIEVMKAEKTAFTRLAGANFFVGLCSWDGSLGKGIDDMTLECRRRGLDPLKMIRIEQP